MESEIPQQKSSFKCVYFAHLVLRILVIVFTIAAAIIMVTSDETVNSYGIVMQARYTYTSSFKFLLVADFLVCALSVLSMVLIISLNRPQSNPKNYFYLFLNDLVSLLLLLSGGSAAAAIGLVAKYGQAQSGWIAICNQVEKFCYKNTVSVAASFVAVACLFVLTVMSAHQLKSLTKQI